jgi:lysophospholipid acyltransferase (LPLAT)-like uncharacterized protein
MRVTTVPTPDRPRRSWLGKRVNKLRKRALRLLGRLTLPWLAPPTLRWLVGSCRVERIDEQHFTDVPDDQGVLLALWHGRMILGMSGHRGDGHTVLVSPSDDGSLVVKVLPSFGYGVIRGSSSRGQFRALRDMLRELRASRAVAITPDGPRGPRHSMNEGLAWLSSVTGFPVIPCGFVADDAWHLRSWDALTIPKPRARVALVYGAPLHVARGAGDDELAAATDEIQRRMLEAERRGFEHLGREPDW